MTKQVFGKSCKNDMAFHHVGGGGGQPECIKFTNEPMTNEDFCN